MVAADPAPATADANADASRQQRRRSRRQAKASSSSSSSSSDDEPTEEEKVYWAKAEEILREYNLSKMAMVSAQQLIAQTRAPSSYPSVLSDLLPQGAARLWIKEMGHPVKGKSLHRVQVWFLHRMQGRRRSPPLSAWQGGCPEIIPKLRALPWWSTQLEWLPKLQVRSAPRFRNTSVRSEVSVVAGVSRAR